MMKAPEQPEPTIIELHVTPTPGNHLAPPMRRLARLLKAMLRGYGWRCVQCRPVAPAAPAGEVTEGSR